MLVVFSLAGVAKASLLSLSYRLLLWWADVLCVCVVCRRLHGYAAAAHASWTTGQGSFQSVEIDEAAGCSWLPDGRPVAAPSSMRSFHRSSTSSNGTPSSGKPGPLLLCITSGRPARASRRQAYGRPRAGR